MGDFIPAAATQLSRDAEDPLTAPRLRTALPRHGGAIAERGVCRQAPRSLCGRGPPGRGAPGGGAGPWPDMTTLGRRVAAPPCGENQRWSIRPTEAVDLR